jgi:hypothetical protein
VTIPITVACKEGIDMLRGTNPIYSIVLPLHNNRTVAFMRPSARAETHHLYAPSGRIIEHEPFRE